MEASLSAYLVTLSTAVISFCLGFIVSSFTRGIERRNLEQSMMVDTICELIDNLAAKAAAYWSLNDGDEVSQMEIEIVGLDYRLGAFLALLSGTHKIYDTQCKEALASFSEHITGGEFQVRGRRASVEHAHRINQLGTALAIEVRRARLKVVGKWFQ